MMGHVAVLQKKSFSKPKRSETSHSPKMRNGEIDTILSYSAPNHSASPKADASPSPADMTAIGAIIGLLRAQSTYMRCAAFVLNVERVEYHHYSLDHHIAADRAECGEQADGQCH